MNASAQSGPAKKILALIAAFSLFAAISFQQATLASPANSAPKALSTKALRVVAAAPTSPVDESKVPHYFGPYPNWANSPFTQSTAVVTFNDPGGNGVGAKAVAQIDPETGGIASIDVTAPGHDYAQGTTVTITGGSGATATPIITASGAVVSLQVSAAGHGYSSFDVAIAGGGGTDAEASATGGVDAVDIVTGGSDYTFPTVDFDLPADPNGTQARGHVPMIRDGDAIDGMNANGTITAVVVDVPGSGYTDAPGVTIHNGTLMDPISGATPAQVTSTLELSALTVDEIGSGYTGSPNVTITDPTGTGTGATAQATTDSGAIAAIDVETAGTGYLTQGIKKFQDDLPLPCDPTAAGTGCPAAAATPGMGAANKFIPLGVPEAKTYNGQAADEYVIGLVQYRTKFSSDLPATLARGYVQLSTAAVPGQHVQLFNELMDGTKQDTRLLRCDLPAVARPDHRGHEGQAGPDRLPQPAADGRRRRPVPAHRHHPDGLRHGPDGHDRPGQPRHRDGRASATRCAPSTPKPHRLLHGQPRHAAPARRHHAVDQRRHAAPVDHAGRREHHVARRA